MRFNFRYKKRKFSIEVEKCESVFAKARGLMFRKNPKPLFFIFRNSKRRAIHSFFCKRFYAIWFNRGKIIDEKIVTPWKLSVKPKEKFDRLLEIPEGCKDFLKFVDGRNI